MGSSETYRDNVRRKEGGAWFCLWKEEDQSRGMGRRKLAQVGISSSAE